MGYLHIPNLSPKDNDILLFKECYAQEKCHGSSSHLKWSNGQLTIFSGGAKYETFVALFDKAKIEAAFREAVGEQEAVIFGEAYGGKMQGMSHTYGKELRFIAFDVKIGECWLSVPQAEAFVKHFDIEFIPYVKVSTDMKSLDEQRDAPSVIAVRRGITEPKMREGVVLRPLFEYRKNNGERVILKHKRAEFSETRPPKPIDPAKSKELEEARVVAEEYVNANRLANVLSHFPYGTGVEKTGDIIKAMLADVKIALIESGKSQEEADAVLDNKETRKAISSRTVQMFKVNYPRINSWACP